MVWELYGGRQFVGFRCGTAFGVSRKAASATDALAQNPFRSPSREAVSHSATLERASG
ncbi:hypothetical protein QBC33DRAFT_541288 [Phialemonium atrogriseum]|uniref:Uncharacterized protein n=1 Tax=Phialemonium atrogriseum TaxID=1093897 RepID=A0AAJ0FMV1_9PEZI|nr:uncharacterized protein QBC33DRAFT_541288 [Phialemonium atrogriseum]KAK1766515.1 hypothetical protein QBC33DRAFT_541288 [Phialemonium atrogriseum]